MIYVPEGFRLVSGRRKSLALSLSPSSLPKTFTGDPETSGNVPESDSRPPRVGSYWCSRGVKGLGDLGPTGRRVFSQLHFFPLNEIVHTGSQPLLMVSTILVDLIVQCATRRRSLRPNPLTV